MHLTDSHAHLDMYDDDLAGVLARAHAAGVERILAIGIGDGPETMHRALEIAQASAGADGPEIWASAGIHPQEAHQATPEALKTLAELAAKPRCVAIGEIGLDYYHADNPDAATQQEAFVAQLRVAAQVGKPILIHCRTSELATPAAKARFAGSGPNAAWDDLLRLLGEHWNEAARGVGADGSVPAGIMHCFSGTVYQAQRSLELGFYLSFAGNVTYPAAKGIREAAATAPPDRILIETDAPFLAPIPRRVERNEPALIVHTATTLAGLRNVSLEEIAELTSANFTNLFPSTALTNR